MKDDFILARADAYSHPNKFSARLIQNLKDVSGEYPIVRPGGLPQDLVTWIPDQKEALIKTYPPGNENPTNVTLGPAFVESFFTFASGVKYVMGLTFGSLTDSGLLNTLREAKAVYGAISKKLYALEIGNEPECESLVGYRDSFR